VRVLITIDTLRADHGERPGAGVPLTPAIDGLAGKPSPYTDALANGTVTRSSHASMLTGLYPWRHGIPDNSGSLRPGRHDRWPRRCTPRRRHRRRGEQLPPCASWPGGSTPSTRPSTTTAGDRAEPVASPAAATEAALQWLRAHGQARFFLLVHYFPPHGPYNAPARFRLPGLEASSGHSLPVSRVNYEHGAIPVYQTLGEETDPALYRARYAAPRPLRGTITSGACWTACAASGSTTRRLSSSPRTTGRAWASGAGGSATATSPTASNPPCPSS
jgi:hypothetical protein